MSKFNTQTFEITTVPNGAGADQWLQVDANTIALTLTDGGPFDADFTANGFVKDPIAVTVPLAAATGGGGCVINPTTNTFDPMLPLMALIAMASLW